MCDICVKVSPNLDVNEKAELLRQISHQIVACGPCAEHFKAALDVLLGTTMEERDTHSEASWEEDYRNRDEK